MKKRGIRPGAMLFGLAAFCLSGSTAWAFGPLTHAIEAHGYEDLILSQGSPEQVEEIKVVLDGGAEPYLLLGSIMTDMNQAIEGLGFSTHDRELGMALVEAAQPAMYSDPWKLGFALGYLQHICSDINAQVIMAPALSMGSGLGEPDLFNGMGDDHPQGEVELLMEAGIDFYYGDVPELFDLLDFFIYDRARGSEKLDQILDFYWAVAYNLYGSGIISNEALHAQFDEYIRDLELAQVLLREKLLMHKIDKLRQQSLAELLGRWMPRVQSYLDRTGSTTMSMDMVELDRMSTTPFFSDSRYFYIYFDEFELNGPTIHQYFTRDSLWYTSWPTWDGETFLNGGVQGLARLMPQGFAPTEKLVPYRLSWKNASTGARLTSLSSSSLPSKIRVDAEIFATMPVNQAVTVRVKKDVAGGYGTDVRCGGSSTAQVKLDPWLYGSVPRPVISVELDPSTCVGGAVGLYVELLLGSDATAAPFYTAAWDAFATVPNRDLTQAPYQLMYAPVSKRPGYLPISSQARESQKGRPGRTVRELGEGPGWDLLSMMRWLAEVSEG